MAITITEPVAETTTTTDGTGLTGGAYTPTANTYQVGIVSARGSALTTATLTDIDGAWNHYRADLWGGSSHCLHVYWRTVGGSPTLITPIFDCTGDGYTAASMSFLEVTPTTMPGSVPFRQSAFAEATSTTNPTVSLGSPFLTQNGYVAHVSTSTNPAAITPPTGWTETEDTGQPSPNSGFWTAYRATGETAASVATTAGSSNWGMVALELLDADIAATLAIGAGALTYTGFAPVLSSSTPGVTLTPPTGSLVYTGFAPSLTIVSSITCDFTVSHQTMHGWGGNGGSSQWDSQTEWTARSVETIDLLANYVGANLIRIPARPFSQNATDFYSDWIAGGGSSSTYQAEISNHTDEWGGASDPFHWGLLDSLVATKLVPLRAALAARGESLFVTLGGGIGGGSATANPPLITNTPDAVAFIVAALNHLRDDLGVEIDMICMTNEPDYTPGHGSWIYPDTSHSNTYSPTPSESSTYVDALRTGVNAAGFSPLFEGWDCNNVNNVSIWYDQNLADGHNVDVIGFHSINGLSDALLDGIGTRAIADGKQVFHTENGATPNSKTSADFTKLMRFIKRANVGWYDLFGLESSAPAANIPTVEGTYVQQTIGAPSTASHVSIITEYLRHIMMFVRNGAVRNDATSSVSTLDCVAFTGTNGAKTVIVTSSSASSQTFAISNLPANTYSIRYTYGADAYTATAINQSVADQVIGTGGLVYGTLPAKGIMTIYGAAPAGSGSGGGSFHTDRRRRSIAAGRR